MRIGMNPNRAEMAPAVPDVSLLVVTHYIDDEPYHAERLEVVDACITSMLEGFDWDRSVELLIFDNGSSHDFRDMLLGFNPEGLVLSENVGKSTARKSLFCLARGKIAVFSDDDIYYAPNWFEKQAEILETYPNVGVVSGQPQRTAFRWGCENTIAWAKKNALLETGLRLIPEQYIAEFCRSIGRNTSDQADSEPDYLITYKGVRAWAHGHHASFMCYKDRIEPLLLDSVTMMDGEHILDKAINNSGMLRLTTFERTWRHMGNVMDEDIRAEAHKLGYL